MRELGPMSKVMHLWLKKIINGKTKTKVQMSGKKHWQSPAYTEKHGWGRALQLVRRGKH